MRCRTGRCVTRFHVGADHAGGRTSAAGTHAARCRGGQRRRRKQATGSGAERRPGARRAAPLCVGAFARAAHASAVERTLFDDGHRGRLGLQPVARYRDHPLARGCRPATAGAPISSCAMSHTGGTWSAGYQPSGVEPDLYKVTFSEDRAAIARTDGNRYDNAGNRRSRPRTTPKYAGFRSPITGTRTREIELTSYAEIVARAASRRRGASGLRQTVRGNRVCARRSARSWRRAGGVRRPTRRYGQRILPSSKAKAPGDVQFETDRARFLGRGQTIRAPAAIADGWPLSNTAGAVLDPDLQPAPARADPARRNGARRVLDAGRGVARRGARSGRQASRSDRVRSGDDAGLDPGADAASPSGHRHGRGASVPASRQSYPLFRSDPAAARRRPQARRGARRRRCGRRAFPAICPSCWCASRTTDDFELVRQLLRAHEYWRLEATGRRSGDPERACRVLCPGSAEFA